MKGRPPSLSKEPFIRTYRAIPQSNLKKKARVRQPQTPIKDGKLQVFPDIERKSIIK